MIEFGTDICQGIEKSESLEWLVTNGIGGYATGTVAGTRTRGYHGVLIAALDPPAERTMIIPGLEETLSVGQISSPLYSKRTAADHVFPQGFLCLDNFRLRGTVPVWTYMLGDTQLEKSIWMQPGQNTSFVRYQVIAAKEVVSLEVGILLSCRDHHGQTRQGDLQFIAADQTAKMVRYSVKDQPTQITIQSINGTLTTTSAWQEDFWLAVENYRGLEDRESAFLGARAFARLEEGQSLTLIFSTEASPQPDPEAALAQVKDQEARLLSSHLAGSQSSLFDPDIVDQLLLAADQFIVDRSIGPGNETGKTVIAGYHWFGDWGRDTMIALPGLTLVTGRPEIARQVLLTFSKALDRGMLPNRFPDIGQTPEYNTVDATLWYFEALRAYYQFTGDQTLVSELFPSLEDVIAWHQKGTRYRIKVDSADGLLSAGEPGVQLTWMDAKVDDWVVTPRIGKPVEINALWYNALKTMADFAVLLHKDPRPYLDWADQVFASFQKFWNPVNNCLYDLIDTPQGDDDSLRPNQIFAVSLHHSPLTSSRQQAVVEACSRHLLTPHGLRSLTAEDEAYIGHYGGDRYTRDGAYHQGTVWGWLIGPFIEAHLKVFHDPVAATSILTPLIDQLSAFGVGSIGEVFDGDAPHAPRGCIAQAWSVAEVLRAIFLIEKMKPD